MDEILIEEKKYVSSKRAAKVTGYAKDYIGQLCREGRVPARLVGRSWYVLESAIHDHRFGQEPKNEVNEAYKQKTPTSNWESPRYEAFRADILPSINRLHSSAPGLSTVNNIDSSVVAPINDQTEAPQHLQDSWRAWFDHAATTKPVALSEPEKQEEEKEPEEVSIPIHTVYELPPEDLLPQYHLEVQLPSEAREVPPQNGNRGTVRVIQMVGTVFAMLAVTVAVIGTGYFDKYILSNSQVSLIAGVALYNR